MKLLLPVAGLIACLPIFEAQAQSSGTYRVRLGAGAQVAPEWPGADKLKWSVYPNISVAKGDRPFGVGTPDDSLSIKLISSNGFSAGPAVHIADGRKDKEVGAPVGKVSTTVEAGAFAQYYVTDTIRLRGEVRQGLGGHDGLVGQAGADLVLRDGDRYAFTIGPRLMFANSKHQRAYFGVTPEAALATGLPVYRPSSGIYGIAATSGVQYSLGGNWGLFGHARYERLIGDAEDSPIVRAFGSPDQFTIGAGVNYAFAIKL